MLEAIRLTIINNMIEYHPVCRYYLGTFISCCRMLYCKRVLKLTCFWPGICAWSEQESSALLAMGNAFGIQAPTKVCYCIVKFFKHTKMKGKGCWVFLKIVWCHCCVCISYCEVTNLFDTSKAVLWKYCIYSSRKEDHSQLETTSRAQNSRRSTEYCNRGVINGVTHLKGEGLIRAWSSERVANVQG